MLTADMVRTRRLGGELRLLSLQGATRERALGLAEDYICAAQSARGRTREDFDQLCKAVAAEARDRRLAAGLRKLVEDRCTFEANPEVDPRELRAALFGRASSVRQTLGDDERLDREVLVAEVASKHDLSTDQLERLLYADLRLAQRLLAFLPIGAAELVELYDLAQAQAVLLRAVKVRVEVKSARADVYRQLFRKLKFLRLLCAIEPRATGGGYLLTIDGPYSLFRAVTKYGLQLALLLPAIRACDSWSLEAEVKWGKRGGCLTFSQSGSADAAAPDLAATGDSAATASRAEPEPVQEVTRLQERFDQQQDGPWRARPCRELLSLPGVGVCVPDLVFEHRESRFRVYFEALGYWSRPAVWHRVSLVEQGLAEPILFAVSDRLRVSEAALAPDAPAALYVYKRVMSRKAVESKLDALRER